uniref:Uncharacterized protein n=1 Tax=Pristionchus pacificus TaxID=54126 RepID=A0A2A6B649_PRIPA|eukprot:PDM61338.1 hypothetical protein PRIPAC_50780 [Pristionchus pacificus]
MKQWRDRITKGKLIINYRAPSIFFVVVVSGSAVVVVEGVVTPQTSVVAAASVVVDGSSVVVVVVGAIIFAVLGATVAGLSVVFSQPNNLNILIVLAKSPSAPPVGVASPLPSLPAASQDEIASRPMGNLTPMHDNATRTLNMGRNEMARKSIVLDYEDSNPYPNNKVTGPRPLK